MASDSNITKHLDVWTPDQNAGDPIGCIATSFTFDSLFFEEECLGRFVNIQSNPDIDGPVYLIELEEKLSGLQCASVIVDQHHCQGARNIRWDLLPARIRRGGVMHAKIALLHWSQAIRLVISSANITVPGYRENQEIFGVIDYKPEQPANVHILKEICEHIKGILNHTYPSREDPAADRLTIFIDNIIGTINKWNLKDPLKNHAQIDALLINPGGKDLFEKLKTHWDNNCSGVPHKAIVISPFYNPPDDVRNYPSRYIWDLLRKRGKAYVIYTTRSEKLAGATLIKAPETLMLNAPENRQDISVDIRIIEELIRVSEKEIIRPFHLKAIWIENDQWVVYMIGSSNFTTSGTGINGGRNFEANLIYTLSKRKDPKAFKQLKNTLLQGKKPDSQVQFMTDPEINTDEEGTDELRPLPAGFDKIILKSDKDKYYLEMRFAPPLPDGFKIYKNEWSVLYKEEDWYKNKNPKTDSIHWNQESIPSGVFIKWDNSDGYAYWPVLVEDQKILPPVEDLKDLPLEILIRIITSARPLHQVIRSWIKRNQAEQPEDNKELVNPHDRVDTSSFLLQRTRRVSSLLTAFRQRLERPVYTEEALHWRLYGPIGVRAIANAIIKEGQSEEEEAFLLSELFLELSRLNYAETPTSLPKTVIDLEIKNLTREFAGKFRKSRKNLNPYMRNYIMKSFKTAIK